MLVAFGLEGRRMIRTTRQRVALIGLAVGVFVVGALAAGDALARRGFSVREAIERLQEAVAVLLGRVEAIEETDCGCPGLLEPVCVDSRTYVNFCEAACVLARQGVGDFEDLIQFGVPRGTEIHGGPCQPSLPVCGDVTCSTGHICVDGQCVINFCDGFGAGGLSLAACPCPRGFRCAPPPEACGSGCGCALDPETGEPLGCPQVCVAACVPLADTGEGGL